MDTTKKWISNFAVAAIAGASLFMATACGRLPAPPTRTMAETPIQASDERASSSDAQPAVTIVPPVPIETAVDELAKELLSVQGVAGVAIGECEGDPCLRVYLENDSPDLRAKVPRQFRGFKVVTEVTGPIKAPPATTPVTPVPIETAVDELAKKLLNVQGVAGVAIGECEGDPCLRVYLENDSPNLRAKVPRQFRGFKVVTEVTGPIKALPA